MRFDPEAFMVWVLEKILWAPVIAAVIAIAVVGIIHSYRFIRYSIGQPGKAGIYLRVKSFISMC
jgi:hypothetical protein